MYACFWRRRQLVFHFSRSWSAEDYDKSALLPYSILRVKTAGCSFPVLKSVDTIISLLFLEPEIGGWPDSATFSAPFRRKFERQRDFSSMEDFHGGRNIRWPFFHRYNHAQKIIDISKIPWKISISSKNPFLPELHCHIGFGEFVWQVDKSRSQIHST